MPQGHNCHLKDTNVHVIQPISNGTLNEESTSLVKLPLPVERVKAEAESGNSSHTCMCIHALIFLYM